MAPEEAKSKDGMEVDATNGTTSEEVKDLQAKKDEFPPFENDEDIIQKIEQALSTAGDGEEGETTAIENLLQLERVNRGAGAAPETAAVCVYLVRYFGGKKDWKTMSEYVVMLSKRRAQIKMAVSRMVKACMVFLEEMKEEKTKVDLIEVLRDVTAGKIFVELERARLTRILSDIKLSHGDIEGACGIMQEVQVETFSGMEPTEKFNFILEQIRLCLDKNDFIRGGIIAKKILPRQLTKHKLHEIKLRYYALMIRIHTRNEDYVEICMAYLERFETSKLLLSAEEGEDDKKETKYDAIRELKLACMFVLLSAYESKQWDLLTRIQQHDEFENDSTLKAIYKPLLTKFTTHEIIRWPQLMETYESELNKLSEMTKQEIKTEDLGWKSALQERVTEHNLRTLSKYFSRIRMERLSQMLDMPMDDTERKLAAMVSDKKALWAKIDRPAKIVSFQKPKDSNAVLNGWADNVATLLDSVEKTCHLVHRDTMVHDIEIKNKKKE